MSDRREEQRTCNDIRCHFPTIVLLVFLLLCGGTISSSAHAEGSGYDSCSLYEAVESHGYASVTIQGAYSGYVTIFDLTNGDGVFFGQCIEIEITSTVDRTLDITVEHGRRLYCDEYSTQDMVITDSYSLTLYSYEERTFTVYAMCIEMDANAPVQGVYYDLGPLVTGYLCDVVDGIHSSGSQNAAGQCAIWAVTDSAYEEDLSPYGASGYTISSAQTILDEASIPHTISEDGSGHQGDDENNGAATALPAIIFVIVFIIILGIGIPLAFLSSREPQGPQSTTVTQQQAPSQTPSTADARASPISRSSSSPPPSPSGPPVPSVPGRAPPGPGAQGAPPDQTRPDIVSMHSRPARQEPSATGSKRGMEDVALELVRDYEGLTGLTITRKEIRPDGILMEMRGSDGSGYEVLIGMDRRLKEFRKLQDQ